MAGAPTFRGKVITFRGNKVISTQRHKNGGVYLSKTNDRGSLPSSSTLTMTGTTNTAFIFTFIFRTIAPNEVNYIYLQGVTNASWGLYISTTGGLIFYHSNSAQTIVRTLGYPAGVKAGQLCTLAINKIGDTVTDWEFWLNGKLLTLTKTSIGGAMPAAGSVQVGYLGTESGVNNDNSDIYFYRTGRIKRALTSTEAEFITRYDGLLPNTINLATEVNYFHDYTERSGSSVNDLGPTNLDVTLINCTTTLGPTNQRVDKFQQPNL